MSTGNLIAGHSLSRKNGIVTQNDYNYFVPFIIDREYFPVNEINKYSHQNE